LMTQKEQYTTEDVNCKDAQFNTPLYHASCKKKNPNQLLSLFQKLVLWGADVNERCEGGNTALHIAFRDRNKDAIYFLLTHKANYMIANDLGHTPIYYAEAQILKDLNLYDAPATLGKEFCQASSNPSQDIIHQALKRAEVRLAINHEETKQKKEKSEIDNSQIATVQRHIQMGLTRDGREPSQVVVSRVEASPKVLVSEKSHEDPHSPGKEFGLFSAGGTMDSLGSSPSWVKSPIRQKKSTIRGSLGLGETQELGKLLSPIQSPTLREIPSGKSPARSPGSFSRDPIQTKEMFEQFEKDATFMKYSGEIRLDDLKKQNDELMALLAKTKIGTKQRKKLKSCLWDIKVISALEGTKRKKV